MNKFTKVVTKPVRMPLNWALPRHAVEGAKEFKFSSSRYPICPNCSLDRFSLKEQPTEEGNAVWICSTCSFQTVTYHPTLDSIQEWCHENAKEVYRTSSYQADRLEEYDQGDKQGFIAINIKRNMMACYAFLILASLIGCLFIYAAINLLPLFLINTLLFALGCLFMALVFNYRAWQAMTNNLYNSNAKEQFHWWIKTHPWYQKPRDIGSPPDSQPSED